MDCLSVGICFEILLTEPRLHARSSLVGLNQSHRHTKTLAEQTTEEISRGGSSPYGGRRHDGPTGVCVLLRTHRHARRYLGITYAAEVGGIDDSVVISLHGTSVEAVDGHLHVGLSCADPHFSREHSLYGGLLAIVEGYGERREAGLRRTYTNLPRAVLCGTCRYDVLAP